MKTRKLTLQQRNQIVRLWNESSRRYRELVGCRKVALRTLKNLNRRYKDGETRLKGLVKAWIVNLMNIHALMHIEVRWMFQLDEQARPQTINKVERRVKEEADIDFMKDFCKRNRDLLLNLFQDGYIRIKANNKEHRLLIRERKIGAIY